MPDNGPDFLLASDEFSQHIVLFLLNNACVPLLVHGRDWLHATLLLLHDAAACFADTTYEILLFPRRDLTNIFSYYRYVFCQGYHDGTVENKQPHKPCILFLVRPGFFSVP